jgi:hypothetical protein
MDGMGRMTTPVAYVASVASREELELRRLVDQAWELRGTPYLTDACAAIVEWRERRLLRLEEWRDQLAAETHRVWRATKATEATKSAKEATS